jgi:hypothetical protein
MQKGYSGGLLLANREEHKMLAETPPTRPLTGLECSVLMPSTARSKMLRPTKSTAHDWIIQIRDLNQPATNDLRVDP